MLQLFNSKVEKVYNKVKEKYTKMGPDKMSRFTHIEGVCEMATFLAKKYGVDIEKAQIAALVHDYYKYESYDDMEFVIGDEEEIAECKDCNVLYHAYASSHALLGEFGIDDDEIRQAIKYHVFGHTNMTKLEEIILISDYTEINRKYKDCIDVRKTLLDGDLDKAIYDSTLNTVKLLLSQGVMPHRVQYEVLIEYERRIKNE